MKNLLLANDFFATYGMLIILVVLVAALMLYSFRRKKLEDQYRAQLSEQIVPGAKIKTYGGLYGTVVSVIDTTDGKLLVIKTGEGKNVSYQKIHINAVYGIDNSELVTYDAEGNVVDSTPTEKTEDSGVEEIVVEEKPKTTKKSTKKATKNTKTTKTTKKEDKETDKEADVKVEANNTESKE